MTGGGVGVYSMEKNYCYLTGRRGNGEDKKLQQLREREKEGREVNQALEKSGLVVNLLDIQNKLALSG